MEQISSDEYQRLFECSTIIEQDGYGVKVLLTADGYMVKLFRTKRRFSSAIFRPYAVRFASNARKLAAAGISSVHVDRLCYCRSVRRHLIFYRPLPGCTLRQALVESSDRQALLHGFSSFLAELHRKGICFRSIHFGNVLVNEQMEFSLIDVADMSVRARPLEVGLRARNFRHFFRYREDVDCMTGYGLKTFVADYLKAAGLGTAEADEFMIKLKNVLADYSPAL